MRAVSKQRVTLHHPSDLEAPEAQRTRFIVQPPTARQRAAVTDARTRLAKVGDSQVHIQTGLAMAGLDLVLLSLVAVENLEVPSEDPEFAPEHINLPTEQHPDLEKGQERVTEAALEALPDGVVDWLSAQLEQMGRPTPDQVGKPSSQPTSTETQA